MLVISRKWRVYSSFFLRKFGLSSASSKKLDFSQVKQCHKVIGKNKIKMARCLCFAKIGVSNEVGEGCSSKLEETDLGLFSSLSPSKNPPLLGGSEEGEEVMSSSDGTSGGLLRIEEDDKGRQRTAPILRVQTPRRKNTKCPRKLFRRAVTAARTKCGPM